MSYAKYNGLGGVPISNSTTTNGYTLLPGGVYLQWGTATCGTTSGSTSSVSFPISFPNSCLNVTTNFIASSIAGVSNLTVNSATKTGFSTVRQNTSNLDSFNTFYWVAIGF